MSAESIQTVGVCAVTAARGLRLNVIRSPLEITLESTGSTWLADWSGHSGAEAYFDGKLYHSTVGYSRLERAIAKRLRDGDKKAVAPYLGARGDLTEGQYNALKGACDSYYSVILGPPGTGKTTLLKHALKRPGTVLLATTGAAAVRIGPSVCRTVHSGLGFDGKGFTKLINGASRIFVDECSMLDETTLMALLRCNSPITFVGDINQLPSVRPGKVLQDLSEILPTFKLTELLRYEPDSDIGRACAAIMAGEVPTFGGKFLLDQAEDLCGISEAAIALSHTAQVSAIDMLIMVRTNKERTEVNDEFGYAYPYPVMNVLNRYRGEGECKSLLLANGEKGMAKKTGISVFKRGNTSIHFQTDENIVPAWCCTVQKVQGNQSRGTVIGIGSNLRWDRRLLYTGVSRSQEWGIVYGNPTAIAAAVANPGADSRITQIVNLYKEMR